MTDDQIAGLDHRVANKIAEYYSRLWPLPDSPLEILDWGECEPLPDDWPQFPRERWCILPHARLRALVLAERCIELGNMSEAAWLYSFGGKMRIS